MAASMMTLTPPIEISGTKLLESNIPEFEIPEWDDTTAYSKDDEVSWEDSIYVCVIPEGETSTGDTPSDSQKWSRLGPTNRMAMFDGKLGTKSLASYPFTWDGEDYTGIYFKVQPGEVFTSLTMFGLSGSVVMIKVTDSLEGTLLDKVLDGVSTGDVSNWFEYYFEPIQLINDLYEGNLPAYRNAEIEIGIVAPGGDAQLSAFLVGRDIELGFTRFGLRFGITDYSIKNRDEFGRSDVLERGFSKRNNFELRIERGRVDFVQNTLAQYRATPVVYRVLEEFQSTLIYGFYKDFEIILPGLNISRCSLDVEGLNEL